MADSKKPPGTEKRKSSHPPDSAGGGKNIFKKSALKKKPGRRAKGLLTKIISSKKSSLQEGDLKWQNLNKKYEYLLAEYANYRKQTAKELLDLKKYDGRVLIEKLLNNVVDDFDQAMTYDLTDKNMPAFKEGIKMIYNRLKSTLEAHGVVTEESRGKAFDPALHSAIGVAPGGAIPPEHIVTVLKKVYWLHDKLIRQAVVIVAEAAETSKASDKKE